MITFLSCHKSGDTNNAKTKAALLISGIWKYTASTITPAYDYYGDGITSTNLFAIMKACEKDDFETYKANGIWEYNEGPTKCDASADQVVGDTWHFSANETKIFVGPVEHTILELSETTLKLRYSFEVAGVTYTEEDTYGH